MQNFIYTPICKTYKNFEQRRRGVPDSKRDFEEQEKLSEQGYTWMWDADPNNKAKIGDVFAFTKYKDKIQFHYITQVFDPSLRLPSWRDNVGQGNRNVIFLSEPICIIDWKTWVSLNGAKRIMGTCVASKNKSRQILNYISNL
jgi:hypothetical protein